MLLTKPLEQINLDDLRQLIDDEVQEGKYIDYKQSMYRMDPMTKGERQTLDPEQTKKRQVERDKQITELLKDVSSFANTVGGHLVIGMKEENGIPTEVCGVEVDDADKKKLQLDELIQSWLEPRINSATHFIKLDSGRFVFVIRVLQSMTAPHRVTHHDFGHFFGRNSAGAFRMDTSQLRTAFTLSETVFDRIKTFRRERVEQIATDETPMPLQNGPKLILHLIPLESFSSRLSFGVDELKTQITELLPLGSTGGDPRINLDGFLTYFGGNRGNRVSDVPAYVQIFRNGVIEAVNADVTYSLPEDDVHCWRKNQNEHYLLEHVPCYLRSLQNLGIVPPIWLFVSLVEMKDVLMGAGTGFSCSGIDCCACFDVWME